MVLRFVALAALAAIVWFTRDGAAEGHQTPTGTSDGQPNIPGPHPAPDDLGTLVRQFEGPQSGGGGPEGRPSVVEETTQTVTESSGQHGDPVESTTRETDARDFSDFQEDTLSASELGLEEDEGDVGGFVPTSGTGL